MLVKSPIDTTYFTKQFSWLDFDTFNESDGFGFLLYFPEEKGAQNEDLAKAFRCLLKPLLNELIISFMGLLEDGAYGRWGHFCIEIWDIHNDAYNYEPEGKSKETARYLTMLKECNIEPQYNGLCECNDWGNFLPIILDCVMSCKAPYSLYFYCPSRQFMVSFHHSKSIDIYYKEFNPAIKDILKRAGEVGLDVHNWDDYESIEKFGLAE